MAQTPNSLHLHSITIYHQPRSSSSQIFRVTYSKNGGMKKISRISQGALEETLPKQQIPYKMHLSSHHQIRQVSEIFITYPATQGANSLGPTLTYHCLAKQMPFN